MSNYANGNYYLSEAEMTANAEYIYSVLTEWGWSLNAICALLANMQAESTINPGIYEGLDDTRTDNGFGLVQWTPNTKYKEWADQYGYQYDDLYGQLERIRFEMENGLQWIETERYPMSFSEFSTSTENLTYLTNAFMNNYERPADTNQPQRAYYARQWWAHFNGGEEPDPEPDPEPEPVPVKKGMLLIYKYIATRRWF